MGVLQRPLDFQTCRGTLLASLERAPGEGLERCSGSRMAPVSATLTEQIPCKESWAASLVEWYTKRLGCVVCFQGNSLRAMKFTRRRRRSPWVLLSLQLSHG